MMLPEAMTPAQIAKYQIPVVIVTALLWQALHFPWTQALFAGSVIGLIGTWSLALRLWTLRSRPQGIRFKMLVNAVSRLVLFLVALIWLKNDLSAMVGAALLAGFFLSEIVIYPPILRPKE